MVTEEGTILTSLAHGEKSGEMRWQKGCRCMQGCDALGKKKEMKEARKKKNEVETEEIIKTVEKRRIVHIFHFIQAGATFVGRPLRSKLEFIDTFPILFPAMVYAFLPQFRDRNVLDAFFPLRLHLNRVQNDKRPR